MHRATQANFYDDVVSRILDSALADNSTLHMPADPVRLQHLQGDVEARKVAQHSTVVLLLLLLDWHPLAITFPDLLLQCVFYENSMGVVHRVFRPDGQIVSGPHTVLHGT